MNFIRKVKNKVTCPAFSGPLAAGFAFWGILVFYRMLPQSLVFIHIVCVLIFALTGGIVLHRIMGSRWHSRSWPVLLVLLYLGLALGSNYNVLFFYLLTPVYYPFPPPNYASLRTFLIFTAVLANMVIYLFYGGRLAAHLENSKQIAKDLASGIFGFAVGNLLANLIIYNSWPTAFFISLMMLFFWFSKGRRQLLFSVVSIILSLNVFSSQEYIVYTGSLQDAKLEMQIDSPYARTHIYSYNDGECVTIASNYHSITFNCRDPQKLPRGLKYLFDKLVGGKDNYRAMVVGRSLGMYPNTLLAVNPAAEYIQTVEFDPRIMEAVRDRFAKLTVDPQHADKIRYAAGDLSRFVLQQSDDYDLIFFNGIGLSQFQIPFCLPYQEQFLFTPKVLDHVFEELLTDDGVLIIDWGGRSSGDQIHQIGNFPEGVHVRTFWYVMTEPPFTGTPLYYMMASKDAERLDEITKYLARSTFFTDISYVSSSRPFKFSFIELLKDRRYFYLLTPDNSYETRYSIPFSWDRPFMLHGLFNIQLLGLMLLIVLFPLPLIALLGLRITFATGRVLIRETKQLMKKEKPLQGMPEWMITALPFLVSTLAILALVSLTAASTIETLHLYILMAVILSMMLFMLLPRLVKNIKLIFRLLLRLASETIHQTRSEVRWIRSNFPRLFYLWPLQRKAIPWLMGAITVFWLIDSVGRQAHQLSGYGYTWPWAMLIFMLSLGFILRRPTKKASTLFGNILLTLAVILVATWSQMDIADTPSFLIVSLGSGLLCGAAWRRIVSAWPREKMQDAMLELVGGIGGGFVAYQFLLFIFGFNLLVVLGSIGLLFIFWRLKTALPADNKNTI
jgi:hypothetical protein